MRFVTETKVVLVHGAWVDASSWNGVIERLQGEGSTVYAMPNPLRGPSSDAAYLAGILKTISGPMILVGHSYGGAVITNAGTGNSNVKALVYLSITPEYSVSDSSGYLLETNGSGSRQITLAGGSKVSSEYIHVAIPPYDTDYQAITVRGVKGQVIWFIFGQHGFLKNLCSPHRKALQMKPALS